LALLVILVPVTALLLSSIYLFRYRRPLVSLRKEAYEQTLLALPRDIAQLRDQVAHLQTELNKRGEPPPSPNSSSAFTMIELMVSVVILTILASLLFPTLNTAKSRARSAQCKNHLSQIGKALVMYESDYNYLPGAGDAGHVKSKHIPWAFVSTNSWVAKLSPYVDNRATIFTCPEDKAPFFAPGIKAGASISQGETIGRVGATGLATGPHQHYGLKKNGLFVNPLQEHRNLPPGDPVPASAMARFTAERDRALAALGPAQTTPVATR
jgi:prepilin-type N-terminal cleavage/methylation domain-containing protein